MNRRSIPSHLEPIIRELLQKQRPLRAIRDWLKCEHGVDVSRMAVHRLAERLRYSDGAVADLELELEEARNRSPSQLRTLEALGEEFADLAEKALEGDEEQGIKPDLELAGIYFKKQLRAVTEWARQLARLEKHVASKKKEVEESAEPTTRATQETPPSEEDLQTFIAQTQREIAEMQAEISAMDAAPPSFATASPDYHPSRL